jgi:hypothetical protein
MNSGILRLGALTASTSVVDGYLLLYNGFQKSRICQFGCL